jgi:hypothetical protein
MERQEEIIQKKKGILQWSDIGGGIILYNQVMKKYIPNKILEKNIAMVFIGGKMIKKLIYYFIIFKDYVLS